MNFLLDTNLLSEPSKPSPNPVVLAWLRRNRIHSGLAAITFAELRFGIERLVEGKKQRRLERHFKMILEDMGQRVLPFAEKEASEWARYAMELEVHFGAGWEEQVDFRDTLIAATARANGLAVVTLNEKDFPLTDCASPLQIA